MVQQEKSQVISTEDCLSCKIISGLGLIGSGAYIVKQAQLFNAYSRKCMVTLATGIMALGVARLVDLPPFGSLVKKPPS